MSMRHPVQHHEEGFSLIELLIAMAISGIVLGSIFTFLIVQRKYFATQEQVTEMLQNARAGMDMIVREVRLTGYGAPKTQLASWICCGPPWVSPWVSLTSNPQVTQGAGAAPDSISIAGVFDSSRATLFAAANAGVTTLSLAAAQGGQFNTSTKKVFYIGNNEYGVVTGISGDVLTIDIDPSTAENQGLIRNYPAGTSVELVKVITYALVDNTLKRDENTGGGRQPVAENIEDLQITQAGNSVTISLTARTSKPDPDYTHPTKGDRYRRVTSAAQVQLRNLGF